MAEVTIQERTWQELLKVARRRRKKPQTLADEALREYLERQEDEDLLKKSSHAAQSTAFDIRDTEEIIRQNRKRKNRS